MLLTDVPTAIKFHNLYRKEDFNFSLEDKKEIKNIYPTADGKLISEIVKEHIV